MIEITTRELTISDYDRVLALWKEIPEIEICEGDSREEMRAYFERNPKLSRLAERDGVVAGAALCGHDGRRGFIYHFAVAKEFRGQGVGRILLEDCVRGLGAAGLARAILLVADDNSLGQEFWVRNGWEKIEAFPMARDL